MWHDTHIPVTVKKKRTKYALPKEVGHVCVRAVDSTKSGEQSHERHPDHAHPADELFYGQDP